MTNKDLMAGLPQVPAADMKRRGWRGIMREVASRGSVLVTNHAQPEAVIVPAAEYVRLLEIAKGAESKTETELDALRLRFDKRLAALAAPAAGDRLRAVMSKPATLRGRVKAGTGH